MMDPPIPTQPNRILTSCPAYNVFHNELSKAAANNLLRHHYSSVERARSPGSPQILKFKGSIEFYSPALYGAINNHYDARNSERTTYKEYIDRAHAVAKYITEKYGKYLVDINFGPAYPYHANHVLVYTWNSIIP